MSMIASDIISDVNKATEAVMNSAVAAVGPDPTELLNSKLASALSTLGDAQYWEETISPTTIRNELSASDPSNPNSTPILSKGMKWLLASISKGRDVSDFYPHVVKLVGANSLEVRKMVYMYLVQYADHDATTRELSLLSINAFQRGLSDDEQLIRALALRVLSSIRINDILQIQILAVQKCASDMSPYVRKCASNALAKLVPRCDDMQRQMMLQLLKEEILDKESSTMVLTSALVAFCELCPNNLELLHTSYRKICHLLTDMDEWGQVVIIDLMARYCRRFFKEPKGLKQGAAELIDQERRVHRKLVGGKTTTENPKSKGKTATESRENVFSNTTTTTTNSGGGFKDNPGTFSDNAVTSTTSNNNAGSYSGTISRPVTTKGFYSSDEESSDEEQPIVRVSTAAAMRQPAIDPLAPETVPQTAPMDTTVDPDLQKLDQDHQLLLTSTMPLLKSRNAGVVLAVCSLHYYCGVSSIKTRSAIGKALVRIHRGKREIQYVVLTSIRAMVKDCPSAFAPFLSDFFVKTLDPPFTRLIKVDILVSLALEPAAIEAVLNELRAYIRHGDKTFAKTAIRAVGRVVELARIVYDRHGASSGNATRERQEASRIALDALHGLSLVTQVSESKAVVGEAVSVMQSILLGLCTPTILSDGSTFVLEDPNEVRTFAMRRILLLLVSSLSNLQKSYTAPVGGDEDSDEEEEKEESELESLSIDLNSAALSSALWIVGEWMANTPMFSPSSWMHGSENLSRAKQELLRLIDSCFPYFKSFEKEQAIHFASKVWLSSSNEASADVAICEHILAMGRLDVNPNVKDRARFESCLLHASIGLKFDTNGMDEQPTGASLNQEQAKAVLLSNKPSSSYLPIEDETSTDLRFGTLSSLVGHQVRGASTALPPWAKKNSPMALREPIEVVKEQVAPNFSEKRNVTGFYDNDDESESDSDDDSSGSDSSSESGSSSDSSDSDSDDDSSSSSSDDDGGGNFMASTPAPIVPMNAPMNAPMNGNVQNNQMFDLLGAQKSQPVPQPMKAAPIPTTVESDDESSSSGSSSSSSSSDESDDMQMNTTVKAGQNGATMNPNPVDGNLLGIMNGFAPAPQARTTSVSSPTMDAFKGMMMNPTNSSQPQGIDLERDSSAWTQFVRPELCGGLSVQARYLRGPTKDNELRLRNINPTKANAVVLQLGFQNTKTNPIRKIKVLPRSGSGGAKKTLCPPEIMELKGNQSTTAILIFQYASMSNREGDMVGRIEIKQGYGGSIPIDVKPSLGELLQPPKKSMSVADFDGTLARMQGFNRVEAKYTSTKAVASILPVLKKHSSLRQVGDSSDSKLRLVGRLPANDDVVLVKIDSGKITVCCDNVVAINSILSLVKRAVSS